MGFIVFLIGFIIGFIIYILIGKSRDFIYPKVKTSIY